MVARKGQPNLTNDPGKRGGWEYRAVAGINKPDYTRGYFQAGLSFFSALRKAARLRGISGNAYLRRAVAAFAARDLGIPFEDILQDSPAASWDRHRDEETGTWYREFDDGQGFGTWEVK
jgi:hypothetical protein